MRRALTAIVTIAILIGVGAGIWAQAAPGNAAATALSARTVEADQHGRPTDRPVRAQLTVWRLSTDGNRSVRTVASTNGTAVLGNLGPGLYFVGAVPASGHEPFNDDDAWTGYANLVHPCQDLRACVLISVDGQGGMKVVYQHGVEPLDGDLDFLFRPSSSSTTGGGSSVAPPTTAPRTRTAPAASAVTKRILVSVFDTTPGSTNRYVEGADILVSNAAANRTPRAGVNVFYQATNDRGLAMVAVSPDTWSVYVTLPAGYVFDNDQATKLVTVDAAGNPVNGVGFKARRVTTTSTPTTQPRTAGGQGQADMPRTPAATPGSGGSTPATTTPPTTPPTTAPTTTTTMPSEKLPEPLPGEPGGPGAVEEGGVIRYPYPEGRNPLPTPRPGDIQLELELEKEASGG